MPVTAGTLNGFLIILTDKGDSEFLIHAADVEGLCQGIDEELVKSKLHGSQLIPLTWSVELGEWVTIPTTYAGGARRKSTMMLRVAVKHIS